MSKQNNKISKFFDTSKENQFPQTPFFTHPLTKKLIDTINFPIVVMDSEAKIVFANHYFQKITKITPKEYSGNRFGELVLCQREHDAPNGCSSHDDCQSCKMSSNITKTFSTGASQDFEFSMINCMYTHLNFKVTTTLFTDSNNRYVVCTFQDASILKQKEFAERVFLHDIKDSVNPLVGFSKLLREDQCRGNDQSDLLNIVYTTAKRVLDEILSFEHAINVEKMELPVQIAKCDLYSIIDECIDFAKLLPLYEKIKLHKKYIPEAMPIESDAILIGRILTNMLQNAAEATKEGTIKIQVEKSFSSYKISVHNRNIIPEEVQKELFHSLISTKGMGRGRGCFGIKAITEKYLQGKATFVSNRKKGTIFTVDLPRHHYIHKAA